MYIELPDRLATLSQYEPEQFGSDAGLDGLCNLVRATLDVPLAAVSLVDHRRTHHVGFAGFDFGCVVNDESFCSRVVAHAAPLIVSDAASDLRFADKSFVIQNPGVRFYLGVPLIAPDGSALGAICAVDTKPRRGLDDSIDKLMALATTAVEILELRRRVREVSILALTDALTGLPNRAGILSEIEKAIVILARHGLPFGIIYMDVDCFKIVNDTFGHQRGDDLLRLIGRSLAAETGREEASGRLGGDEFVVVLVGATASAAADAAKRLKGALQAAVTREDFSVSFSFGVSCFTEAPVSAAAALTSVDSLLYQAKRSGKDRIVLGSP